MIKYIGSKRVLVPAIVQIICSIPEVKSVIDFFSGTSRVGHALKQNGYRVIANDLLSYAHVLGMCYVQADLESVGHIASDLIAEYNHLPGKPGYFTDTFCVQSRFFQPKNGARIDAIREAIAEGGFDPDLEAVLLVSLMEAADRVDSTTGLQMAYLKSWAPRAYNNLQLRMPRVLPRPANGACEAHCMEARAAAASLTADLAYIDPPYNQHSYLGNYHIWETLVRWDKPDFYGTACKRVDCKTRKSDFNSRIRAESAFREFLDRVDCSFLVVSFNNEGYIHRSLMERLLSKHGDVYTVARDYKRYVGAQIGIYNPHGNVVGKVSHLRNKEYIYVVVPSGYPWQMEDLAQEQEHGVLFAE